MDVQAAFDFEQGAKRDEALRLALRPFGLPHWSVELIVLMARDGRPREIAGHQCYELSVSKRKAAAAMGCAPNTFVTAAEHLRRLGVLEVVCFGRQRTYVLSRDLVNGLAPIGDDPLDELGLFAERAPPDQTPERSVVVSGGQRARVRERKDLNTPCTCSVPCTCSRGGADQQQPRDRGQVTGDRVTLRELRDEDVRAIKIPVLKAAFLDAVRQGWLCDEHEDKRKFLAVCHHAARSVGIHYPARVVYAAVKDHKFDRVSQASWDWAGQFLRQQVKEYA